MVDIVFAGAGPWGAGKGSRLTRLEADTDLYNLKTAIEDLIASAGPGTYVDNIVVTGRQLTFYMSDATTVGPFTLPYASFTWRGLWQAGVAYSELDVITVNGYGLFLVLQDHTAAGSFDPDAGNSAGDYYRFMLPSQILRSYAVPATTHTPSLAQANSFFRCSNAAGCAVTLPDNLPEDTEVSYRQGGAGPVTFTASGTIQGMAGFDNQTNGVGSIATAKYMDGVWHLWGRLAPVSA